MNRLVIIGNGFDLAHGLPTSYRDFIDDFWRNIIKYYDSYLVKKMVYFNLDDIDFRDYYCSDLKNYNDFIHKMKENDFESKLKFDEKNLKVFDNNNKLLFQIENNFFKEICLKNSEKWVDIENEYYKQLKTFLKSPSLNHNEINKRIVALNNDFEEVKSVFESYLFDLFESKYDWFGIKQNELEDIFREKFYLSSSGNNKDFKQTLLLSFNYTKTVEDYNNYINENISCNYIHGRVNKSESSIIFGFGDEMDEDYKLIENINDNEFLKNFKSFQYLQNSNYSNLLSYIDSEKFQVLIMGHSCGLSDRILLNTIFEHENCNSIKVFYHERSDGSDNYTDIVQNISRHFNDKKIMRSKIVSKPFCKPMPQIQLPKKE